MRINRLIIFIFILMLTGCSHQKIYLFGRYLSQNEIEKLENDLSKKGFNVETNNHYFPSAIKTNTLVHNFVSDEIKLNSLIFDLNQLNYSKIDSKLYAFSGKHFFTQDSIGLYLFPSQLSENSVNDGLIYLAEKILTQDVYGMYEVSTDCPVRSFLLLSENMSFTLSDKKILLNELDKTHIYPTGKWYLEQDKLTLIFYDETQDKKYRLSSSSQYVDRFLKNTNLLIPLIQVDSSSFNQVNCGYEKHLMEV